MVIFHSFLYVYQRVHWLHFGRKYLDPLKHPFLVSICANQKQLSENDYLSMINTKQAWWLSLLLSVGLRCTLSTKNHQNLWFPLSQSLTLWTLFRCFSTLKKTTDRPAEASCQHPALGLSSEARPRDLLGSSSEVPALKKQAVKKWVWVNTYRYILVGWTSIYQLFWGSLGTRVLTHPQITEICTDLVANMIGESQAPLQNQTNRSLVFWNMCYFPH